MALIASQNPPAPSPSSRRPFESRSRDAAALASMAGGRRGRLATSGKTVTRLVRAAMAVSSVQEVDARRVGPDRLLERPQRLGGVGEDEVAELDGAAVVHMSLEGLFGRAYFVLGPCSAGKAAAVDGQHRAGDEGGLVRAQPYRRARDLFDAAEPAERNEPSDRLQSIFGQMTHLLVDDGSRCDRVDADVLLAVIEGG